MCFGALGTDTGGSIRIPSAACGTVGLKATNGEISCEGVVALARRSIILGRWRGVSPTWRSCSTCCRAVPRTIVEPVQDALIFGVPRAYFCDRVEPGVAEALSRACEALAKPRAIRCGT